MEYSVTITSILRLVYMIRRFYYNDDDEFFTEFQVNFIRQVTPLPILPTSNNLPSSTVEIDVAIICACLPTLRAFMKRFAPRIFTKVSSNKPSSYGPRAIKRTTNPPSLTQGKSERRWENGSHEESLVGGTYIELGEDGKSDQSYAMTNLAPARSEY